MERRQKGRDPGIRQGAGAGIVLKLLSLQGKPLRAVKRKIMKKYWAILTILLAVVLAVFVYIRFFFVFGEGVKSGELNYVVYKGVLFKTYEGKLIQSGIRSKTAGSIQSYEFEFSVEDAKLARELMLQGGRTIELHYKEYFGALPWRGFTKFIVDSIVTSRPAPLEPTGPDVMPAPSASTGIAQ